MKKILTIGAAIALALGFASCNKNKSEEIDTPTQEGTTYMSLTFRLPAEFGTRAEDPTNNGIGQWEGRDKFDNVDVYLVTAGAKSVEKRSLTEVTKADPTRDGVYKTESWKTTPGEKTVYVVVNNGGDIKAALDAATVTNFADEYKKAYEMLESGKVKADYASVITTKEGTKDIIMMTGQPVKQKINDGVSQDDANKAANTAAASVDKNKVQVTVRRVVSRVSVSATSGLISDRVAQIKTTDDKVIGQLKDLSWTPMQLEKTSYLLWQDAVEYTATATKSPNYSYVPANGDYTKEAPKFYSYDRKGEALPIRTDFVRKNNPENIAWITGKGNNMEFITENTHGDYKRGNTTYVKVTGTFMPNDDTWASVEEKNSYVKGESIFWGATTGKFYSDIERAKAANPVSDAAKKEGKDGVIEFKAGKMYYFAWINPDKTNHLEWTTSPVVRNNIYHINISAFKNVGLYRNPYDPKDPDPKDPDDPDPKDPEDPLNDKETYMVTEVTVINWGMHSYDVEF